ncbi:FACT complex subunit [Mycoemilia scoparia]|uniref:FACT complex subunit POB3 n=1 Tax=Mycoemilia scoparia TaxID=417184 RepID=A0A9W8DW65_9FUNG|nr:FACT complex subunit [Mycoemilia scoparia]
MSDAKVQFNEIFLTDVPYIVARGQIRLGKSGIGWKAASDADMAAAMGYGIPGYSDEKGMLAIQSADIRRIQWQRVAKGFGIRIWLKDGTLHKLDGFDRDDYDSMKDAVKRFYKGITLENRDVSLKGWNWGKTDFEGQNLTFKVENKPMFDIPMNQVSNTNLAGKNEVSIELQPTRPGTKRKAIDEMVEVRFYVPGTTTTTKKPSDGEDSAEEREEEANAATIFYETLKDKADVGKVTGDSIVLFSEVLCLTPRGRYDIDMYPEFLRLRGKTYDYKVMYENITRLFLLAKPDGMHTMFIVGLNPPIRQGQTRYPFLVFQFVRDEEADIELALDKETHAAFAGKLEKRYDQPLYLTVSNVFTGLVDKKVVESSGYRTFHGAQGIKCSLKANEGIIYPLEKGIIFVPKPVQYISLSEIGSVVFSRVGSSATSARTFDLKINLFGHQDIQFSNVNREEYENLVGYMRDKDIKVMSELDEEGKKTFVGMDASSDEESAIKGSILDEDFIAESESDVQEEYDENYESGSGDE